MMGEEEAWFHWSDHDGGGRRSVQRGIVLK